MQLFQTYLDILSFSCIWEFILYYSGISLQTIFYLK